MGCLRIDRLARSAGSLVAADGRIVAARAFVADRAVARLVGMLGTPDPRTDEALLLVPCRAVHAIGMRTRLGAAFLDAHGVVLRVVDPLPRRGASCRGARAVVEAASGALALVTVREATLGRTAPVRPLPAILRLIEAPLKPITPRPAARPARPRAPRAPRPPRPAPPSVLLPPWVSGGG